MAKTRRRDNAVARELGAENSSAEPWEAALHGLLRHNAPGRLSLAGAYAFGYVELARAQMSGDDPPWYQAADPLDILFMGATFPERCADPVYFALARDAWLRRLDGSYRRGVREFVRLAVIISQELGRDVDDIEVLKELFIRVIDAGLDDHRVPRKFLPGVLLAGDCALDGPLPDLVLPEPPDDARDQAEWFWAWKVEGGWPGDSPRMIMREGLDRLETADIPAEESACTLLVALYMRLLANPSELGESTLWHAVAWARAVDGASPLVPLLDVLLAATDRDLSSEQALGHLFSVPAFSEPIPSEALIWTTSPGLALPRLAFELGFEEVRTRWCDITHDYLDRAGMRARMRTEGAAQAERETSHDVPDATDEADPGGTEEEAAERREALRATVRERIGAKKAGRTAAARERLPRASIAEQIWNADGGSVIRFAPDSEMAQELISIKRSLAEEFREKYGRDPGPEDPFLFDPDADEPAPLRSDHWKEMCDRLLEDTVGTGIDPAFILAMRDLGYMVSSANHHLQTAAEIITFERAVERHRRASDGPSS